MVNFRREQEGPAHAGTQQACRGCIGDVQQRTVNGDLHVIGQAMHRIGTDDQTFGSGPLQPLRGLHKQRIGGVPVPGMPVMRDDSEIE